MRDEHLSRHFKTTIAVALVLFSLSAAAAVAASSPDLSDSVQRLSQGKTRAEHDAYTICQLYGAKSEAGLSFAETYAKAKSDYDGLIDKAKIQIDEKKKHTNIDFTAAEKDLDALTSLSQKLTKDFIAKHPTSQYALDAGNGKLGHSPIYTSSGSTTGTATNLASLISPLGEIVGSALKAILDNSRALGSDQRSALKADLDGTRWLQWISISNPGANPSSEDSKKPTDKPKK